LIVTQKILLKNVKCRRGRGNRKRGQVRGWTAAPVEEGGGGEGKGE